MLLSRCSHTLWNCIFSSWQSHSLDSSALFYITYFPKGGCCFFFFLPPWPTPFCLITSLYWFPWERAARLAHTHLGRIGKSRLELECAVPCAPQSEDSSSALCFTPQVLRWSSLMQHSLKYIEGPFSVSQQPRIISITVSLLMRRAAELSARCTVIMEWSCCHFVFSNNCLSAETFC